MLTFENYQRTSTVDNMGFCYSILTTPFDSNYKPYGFGIPDSGSRLLYSYFKINNNTIYWYYDVGIVEDCTTNQSGEIYYYWAIG